MQMQMRAGEPGSLTPFSTIGFAWSELGRLLNWMYALSEQDPSAPTTFETARQAVFGSLLLFYNNPEWIGAIALIAFVWLIVVRKTGCSSEMLDRVLCFAWGPLQSDNWHLDNPYTTWIQLIQTSLEEDRILHKQSIYATSPRGVEELVHKSRLKGRRQGRLGE